MRKISMTVMTMISSMCLFVMSGCGSDDKDTSKDGNSDVPAESVKKVNGDSCSFLFECLSNYCSPLGICADSPVVSSPKANGESCATASDCQSNYCSPLGVCADSPAASSPKANGESCAAASDCLSNYCDAKGQCADEPSEPVKKANGESCKKADECKSNYCNAKGLCDDEPSEPAKKANGESCKKDDECESNYCNAKGQCADASAKKANGESCKKADECESNYCNAKGQCAELSITADKQPNGKKCSTGKLCISNYCNTEGKCADQPVKTDGVLSLIEVPEEQNNKEGADCDRKTFVEHCDGTKVVSCENNDDKTIVEAESCAEGYHCALSLLDGKNRVMCIDSKSSCSKGTKDDITCDVDQYGYEMSATYKCLQFEDGLYYYAFTGLQYCSGRCTSKGCSQETCNPADDQKCSADGKTTMECDEIEPGKYIYKSYNCSAENTHCAIYEGWATCEY